jgi:hypothetical protein
VAGSLFWLMDRFTYQLTVRPAGVDTTPIGVGRAIHDTNLLAMGRNYGSVSYDQALPLEDIQHYALLPVSQMRELNGKEFTQTFLGVQVRHLVTLSPSFKALVVQTTRAGRIERVSSLSWSEFVVRSKNWVPAGAAFEYLKLGEPLPFVTPCPSGRNDCPSGCGKCPAEAMQEGAES